MNERNLTLPTDSAERKEYPLLRGLFRYFPAALAGVARHSKLGNDKHNPGEELHHARGKSMDHGDCILRHQMDLEDMLAAVERGDGVLVGDIVGEADALAWRALALSQELHERFWDVPLAPGARLPRDVQESEEATPYEELPAEGCECLLCRALRFNAESV